MKVNKKEFKRLLTKFWRLRNCQRFEFVNLMVCFFNLQICLSSRIFIVDIQFILFLKKMHQQTQGLLGSAGQRSIAP